MAIRLLPVFYLITSTASLCAQTELQLVDISDSIANRLEINIKPHLVNRIHDITGEKLTIKVDELKFNGQPTKVKSFKTRGNTTLKYRRKSFSLSLEAPLNLHNTLIKRMAINNLAMDENYWRARLSFIIMSRVGIFPLVNQYAELRINDQTQGTYLMIQKPEDYCREINSKLLLRKETRNRFEVEYAVKPVDKKYVSRLRSMTDLTKLYSGVTLLDTLNSIIDFESYCKWLAINYLLLNGDYVDELFLFIEPETDRFNIIPWDYDDIFASKPHEGTKRHSQLIGDKLIFSSESSFDVAVSQRPFLYKQYLEYFQEVLTMLTPEVLKKSFEQIYQEVMPFFLKPDIISQSQFDQSGLTNIENLQNDLSTHYKFLVDRRNTLETTLILTQKENN